MGTLLIVGAAGMLIPAGAILLLLRKQTGRSSQTGLLDEEELSWRHFRPLDRLLDPADFAFLRRSGMPAQRIRKLRCDRRRIYGSCLRSLRQEFNLVYRTLNLVLVESPQDRPELAAHLARQRVTFYRNLALAEFRLLLHRCGVARMPAIDLVAPLEALQAQLQRLVSRGAV